VIDGVGGGAVSDDAALVDDQHPFEGFEEIELVGHDDQLLIE
jgi:hypothetical protein